MTEFETTLSLMIIGFISLIITLTLYLMGKKIQTKEITEQKKLDVKIFNFRIKLIPFLYLIIVLIMFIIGMCSDFLFNTILGLIVALIPFITYWIFDYKKYGLMRKK